MYEPLPAVVVNGVNFLIEMIHRTVRMVAEAEDCRGRSIRLHGWTVGSRVLTSA